MYTSSNVCTAKLSFRRKVSQLYLVVDCPTDVLEVGVVEEVCVVLLHPLPDLEHADAPDLWQGVSVAMDEDGLEHVGQHVLDLVCVLLKLLPPGHQCL